MPIQFSSVLNVGGNKEVLNRILQSHRANESDSLSTAPAPLAVDRKGGVGRCSKCPGFVYVLPDEFRNHSRSEWHIFNLRRDAGETLTFDAWCNAEDSDSDFSSSESSVAPDSSPQPDRIYLEGLQYSEFEASGVWFPSSIGDPRLLIGASFVCVLILRAGRFAGAIWDADGNIIAHTSFKRYTVRRKNGGSQSKSDRSKGSPAQSVGAQIRREQEKKLSEEVRELVQQTWSRYFTDSKSVVFAYASKVQVDDLFIGPLDKVKHKCQLLKIPMSIRDPTFSEVCRIHNCMTRFGIVNKS